MPSPTNQQSHMDTFMGRAPALDSDGFIDDIAMKLNVVAKTADYTVKHSESGTFFTTEGATAAVNFTLPAAASGLVYWFFSAEDVNMTVTADTADTMVAMNDVAADSIAFSTTSEKIGGAIMAVSDGSKLKRSRDAFRLKPLNVLTY